MRSEDADFLRKKVGLLVASVARVDGSKLRLVWKLAFTGLLILCGPSTIPEELITCARP